MIDNISAAAAVVVAQEVADVQRNVAVQSDAVDIRAGYCYQREQQLGDPNHDFERNHCAQLDIDLSIVGVEEDPDVGECFER